MTIKDYIGEEGIADLRRKFDEWLDSESGFIFIGNMDKHRVTDAYKSVCANCVIEAVAGNLKSAVKFGLVSGTVDVASSDVN